MTRGRIIVKSENRVETKDEITSTRFFSLAARVPFSHMPSARFFLPERLPAPFYRYGRGLDCK